MQIDTLISRQNPDGGWPCVRGRSWTEATVYAIMALLAVGEKESVHRGVGWLRKTQRGDGGWAAQVGVDQSNWTTGLAALLPREVLGPARHRAAIEWLMGTTGQETSFEYRLRQWLLGSRRQAELEFAGWPWVPGAAAWVGPTAIAILALDKENRRRPLMGIHQRVEAGRKFLLTRTCQDGGWNHGSARPLGYESKPYPETTGMGLAALRGVQGPKVQRSVSMAQQFLTECRSTDAQNWLRLGLAAHGELPPGYCRPQGLSVRTVPEMCLDILASDGAVGRSFFWC